MLRSPYTWPLSYVHPSRRHYKPLKGTNRSKAPPNISCAPPIASIMHHMTLLREKSCVLQGVALATGDMDGSHW